MMNKFKTFLSVAVIAATAMSAYGQSRDWGQLERYDKDNKVLINDKNRKTKVVFIGNSITDNWASMRPQFFADNNFVGRGISGQTSYQFLVRFREDVVNLSPEAVVINTGTNDVAENTGPYDEDRTFGNILSMVEMAKANGIKVILSTVLPAKEFVWNPSIKDAPEKINSLNRRLKEFAKKNKLAFIDYHTPLLAPDNVSLNPAYCNDGVHPTEAGYEIMEQTVLPIIKKVTK